MDIPSHFSDLARAAYHVAKEAGSLLKSGYQKDFDIIPKEMKNDVVTSYDYASEQLIVARLSSQFPNHSFLCEERGAMPHSDGPICWMIDPLDGTVNFAHHVPLFCVTLAACRENEILCGVTYAPVLEEFFIAEKGKGAYLNGKRLKVSRNASPHTAYMGTSLSFNLHLHPTHSIDVFSKMAHLGSPMRALGSTALNMGYIAAGRFDAYWSISGALSPWDVAAGILLIEEAGGSVTQASGMAYNLEKSSSLLATNGKLHQELIQYLHS